MLMITPPPSSRCGIAAWLTRNVPVRLTRDDLRPLLERRLVRVREPADARAVEDHLRSARGPSRPPRPRAAPTPGRTRRPVYARAEPLCSAISAAVFSAASPAMSRHATGAPSSASCCAVARPSPEPAPVTSATRPSNRPMCPPCRSGAESNAQPAGRRQRRRARRTVPFRRRARLSRSGGTGGTTR